MRKVSVTMRLAAAKRGVSHAYAINNATRIASVCGRLRAHAGRCKTEKGYAGLPYMNRQVSADAISGTVGRLEERRQLMLSCSWWLERAEAMLATLDKANGGKS